MSRVDDLFEELKTFQSNKRLPPVELWQPERIGEIDIRIDRDGGWHHEGRPIDRLSIARVFSTILRLDDGEYFLVTSPEKLKIVVDDVPFIGIDAQVRGDSQMSEIIVSTNMDDHVELSGQNPLEMREGIPYVEVRNGLFARLSRNVYYRLIEHGQDEDGIWCLYSNGTRFELGSTD
ncbi:MAG: DUF1285 domain-containing protein [Pseudomonadales bacterium]|nr:DUF1285 domain-containing protein [Pseudomonadales bacterium]